MSSQASLHKFWKYGSIPTGSKHADFHASPQIRDPPPRPAPLCVLAPVLVRSPQLLSPPEYSIRYKTIFIGSRLDARLLNNRDFRSEFDGTEFDERDLETGEMDDSDVDDDPTDEGGGMSIGRGGDGDSSTAKRTKGGGRGESMRRVPSRSRQQSTQELVDFFAGRMQEARGAWTARVEALQKRWRASILRGDWGRRNARLSDRDEALKMTFGLMVRLYAYEDALNDLRRAAEEEPSCLEFFAPQVRAEYRPEYFEWEGG